MNVNFDKYDLIQNIRIEELKSDGFLLKHRKSGARVVLMATEDDNKVFSIGFRTPPPDSTGVPHILEHSVLCGSAKYPVKDPFIELAKGSLNTFLNAMTYPDKTMYPVASCNDADFKNLMDVYMDAVLNPAIYEREEIFLQEGWHYEMETLESPLTYNGVVYNEMKGAFSSPDEVLSRYCLNSLYPDTSYSTESGGDPDCIPDLTYENFLAFHKKLYHPSNSYIFLYGNCDMEERLEYLDKEYLSHYEFLQVDSEIRFQEPFDAMKRVESVYSVTEEEGTEHKTYLSYNLSVGSSLDKELYMAFQILDYALLSSPGAPLKQALIEAGIGEDVYSSYENGLRQPMFSIVAKNTDESREAEFLNLIQTTLQKIRTEGLNKQTLLAGINSFEFRYREADFGRFPKGLMYGLNLMDSWLYDENQPFLHLSQNETFKYMKEQIDTGYFEELIEAYLLNNTHASMVVLKPVINLTDEKDAIVADRLEQYKNTLSSEAIQEIVDKTAALKEYQSIPTSEEDLQKIPLLTREDISSEITPLYNRLEEVEGVSVDHHDIYTNGIGYLNLAFDIKNVPDDEIKYVGLLGNVIGYIDTKQYTYDQLSSLVDINTGGIAPDFTVYQRFDRPEEFKAVFSMRSKALFEKFDFVFDLIHEMMFESKYDDHKRLKEILAEVKSRLQSKIMSSGHVVALGECLSQLSEGSRYTALTTGIQYYEFVADLYENFDEKKDEITEKLHKVSQLIFVRNRLLISFTGDLPGYEIAKKHLEQFIGVLPATEYEPVLRQFVYEKKKIGFKTSSQVNYVARCGDFSKAGIHFDSALKVLRVIMGYDYLWTEIRVKGGAYGCMNGYGVTGLSYYLSYRDPNCEATNKVYEGIPEYLRNFKAGDREMTKYIIGTFSEMDTPLTPQGKGNRSFDSLLRGIDEEYYRKDRLRVLNTYVEDIRGLADTVEAILASDYLCVIGNGSKIEKDKDMFDEIRNLL